jgi:hypothetical protein
MWSRVTCLALPLAAALSLGSRVLKDSWSRRRLTIAIGNKQINKQYTKQYQKILLVATNAWAQESSKSELRFESYEGFKLRD